MMTASARQPGIDQKASHPSCWSFILFPAIAVMLGWGWRGFIGGGPFAAMIPGAFIALSLSLLLGHDRKTAAIAALFGAVGIGCGGEMTYGQTLGLACDPETMAWGLLGVTVKGAIWGLLGGAVLGAGLTCAQYAKRTLLIGCLLTVVFLFLGWKLINEPRLIYFSDPVNKPREELWAGLLFSALAFLGWIHGKGNSEQGRIPLHFALWGALAGGIGFGGGTLFLVYGPTLPVPQQWFGWWKAMEFFFGFSLGAGFGYCAWRQRKRLGKGNTEEASFPGDYPFLFGVAALVAVFFLVFPAMEAFLENPEGLALIVGFNVLRPLYTFVFFGAVCIALGLYSVTTAWHVAITVTFMHTIIDLNRNISRMLDVEAPFWVQTVIFVLAVGAIALVVHWLRNRSRAVSGMYLLLIWTCFMVSTLVAFLRHEYINPPEGVGLSVLWKVHPATLTMYAVFVVASLVTTWYVWRLSSGKEQKRQAR